jgi:hypothetical protein
MPRVTWGNIADGANAEMQARIDGFWKRASWSNPALATWESLHHSVEMELMRRKANWNNLGMTEEELLKEMIAEMRAANGGEK